VAVHPFAERDPLADLEDQLLRSLDPPLNLNGMSASALRVNLRTGRASISRGLFPPQVS
jgi:hypothetical protein